MMPNSPDLWDRALDRVRSTFGADAVVAGGCIRDNYLGLAPKDIDVFVNVENSKEFDIKARAIGVKARDFHAWLDMNLNSGNTEALSEYGEWSSGQSGEDQQLIGVADFDLDGYEVNLIARRDHNKGYGNLINKFDVGAVQAWYHDGIVGTTPAFSKDIREKTYTLLRDDKAHLSRIRYHRFNTRNPGVLTLVDPFKDTEDYFAKLFG